MTPSLIVTFSCFAAKIVSFLFLPNREGKELLPAGGNRTSYVCENLSGNNHFAVLLL